MKKLEALLKEDSTFEKSLVKLIQNRSAAVVVYAIGTLYSTLARDTEHPANDPSVLDGLKAARDAAKRL